MRSIRVAFIHISNMDIRNFDRISGVSNFGKNEKMIVSVSGDYRFFICIPESMRIVSEVQSMSFSVRENVIGFSQFLTKKMDWHYFRFAILASAMYLFNAIVISMSHGALGFNPSSIAGAITSLPLLTLVYLTALLELMNVKIISGAALKRIRKIKF